MDLLDKIRAVSVPHTVKATVYVSHLPKIKRNEIASLYKDLRTIFFGPWALNVDDVADRCQEMLLQKDDPVYRQVNFYATLMLITVHDDLTGQIERRLLEYLREIITGGVERQYLFNILKPERLDQAQILSSLTFKAIVSVEKEGRDKFIEFASGNEVEYRIGLPEWYFVVQDGCYTEGHPRFRDWSVDYKENRDFFKDDPKDPNGITGGWFLAGIAYFCRYMRKHPKLAKQTVAQIHHDYQI